MKKADHSYKESSAFIIFLIRGRSECKRTLRTKGFPLRKLFFYVETCFLLIFGNIIVFCYDVSKLDGVCGSHSIWCRWGRYYEQIIKECPFSLI